LDVKEEAILGPAIKDHWYYVSKGRALRRFLGGEPVEEVLDVGAGSGVFTRQLLDFGLAQRGVCVDPAYGSERVETHNGREIAFVRGVDDVPQKLLLMMDVLEHVDDDIGLLREYTDRMAPGGRVLITVPAFQFLWSGHDVFLEHRRRYTLSQIENVARRAELRVLKGRYFFGALFPLVAAIRMRDRVQLRAGKIEAKSQLKLASSMVNSALVRIHDVERVSLFSINRLAGLTAFCLAVRG
jgi:SAM-dependent methyltransferase